MSLLSQGEDDDEEVQLAEVIRFANRVPLLFQQSACSSFKAVTETGWRNYNLSQPRASLPAGPLVIMIHMASVWVPFTSESKEAIADLKLRRKQTSYLVERIGEVKAAEFFKHDFARVSLVHFKETRLLGCKLSV